MSRPRRISDDEILMATARVMGRVPPSELTLALVGKEVGLAPATLLQRFGSKMGLLQALAHAGAEGMPDALVAVRAGHASPVEAIEAYLAGFAMLAPTAEALANNLAYLQLDLSEPTLRAATRAMFVAHERALDTLLDDAVGAGELRDVDRAGLARTLLALTQGTLIVWGVHRTGSVSDAIRAEVGALLRPYRAQ
jgi:AcrR family transcriptional regulator